MSNSSGKSIEVFFSYSHSDVALRDELSTHLSGLRRQGIISEWHDRQIPVGTEWAETLDERLNAAQIILLLVSADFLFYRYDSLRHFHDAQFRKENIHIEDYIDYEALGLAMLLSLEPAEADSLLPVALRGSGPVRSVVLIDEIDKAPRDLPNDILNEIEKMEFPVKETGRSFQADQRYRPIVVLTSNSERNLPDAFLHRCVFYHIEFPDKDRLTDIVRQRVKLDSAFTPDRLAHAIEKFEQIQKDPALKKAPATAELLAWVQILNRLQIDVKNLKPGEKETLAFSYSALAKNKEDLERLRKNI